MSAVGGSPRWWEGATLCQVYVRSRLDTNEDGYSQQASSVTTLDRRGEKLIDRCPSHLRRLPMQLPNTRLGSTFAVPASRQREGAAAEGVC
jgi:hypothetical protein